MWKEIRGTPLANTKENGQKKKSDDEEYYLDG